MARVLFARIGWMEYYAGPQEGDQAPIGGGAYNEDNLGHEAFNFDHKHATMRAYFEPPSSLNLRKIDPNAQPNDAYIDNSIIFFFAKRPEGGQVVVGWYNQARLFKDEQENDYAGRQNYGFYCEAEKHNVFLLPASKRNLLVPGGTKGAPGRSNIFYLYDEYGNHRLAQWISDILTFINGYQGNSITEFRSQEITETLAADIEPEVRKGSGQGFLNNQEVKKKVELHAMKKAAEYFASLGYEIEDVSSQKPYDLRCTRNNNEELRVEVKGTQTEGKRIFLTKNEVAHARDDETNVALFILHSISVFDRNGKPVATRGIQEVQNPWSIDEDSLVAMSYTYDLA